MNLVGDIGNRGHGVSKKTHAMCLFFAINKSITVMNDGIGNKMDDSNCCIMWLKRHMLCSIICFNPNSIRPRVTSSLLDPARL